MADRARRLRWPLCPAATSLLTLGCAVAATVLTCVAPASATTTRSTAAPTAVDPMLSSPTDLTMNPANADFAAAPGGWIGKTSQYQLQAVVGVPASGELVNAAFKVWDSTNHGTAVISPGDPDAASAQTPTQSPETVTFASSGGGSGHYLGLLNGHTYGLNAYTVAESGRSRGSVIGWFRYDSSAPSVPAVRSTVTSVPQGQQADVVVASNDVVPVSHRYSGVDHFDYANDATHLDDGGGSVVPHSQLSKVDGMITATIPLDTAEWGENYVYVDALDGAGNVSSVATVSYYVQPT